jgi:hypothetical protein
MALMLALSATSMTALAQSPTPTPTASGSPTGGGGAPKIAFLNPTKYPGLPEDEPFADSPPDVSDESDGVDEKYHIVTWVANPPANAVLEAYLSPIGPAGVPLPEITIGLLDPVAGSPDTYELYWDIPNSIPEGNATMIVRMYGQTILGTEEVAKHEIAVQMEHKGGDVPHPGGSTVEFTFPAQNGEIGFFKPRGGQWRSAVDIKSNDFENGRGDAATANFFYTVSAPGEAPKWKQCAASATNVDLPPVASFTCSLQGKDGPSQLTAIGVGTTAPHDPVAGFWGQSGGDAHRVHARTVLPEDMKVSILPKAMIDAPSTTGTEVAGVRCISLMATVLDDLGRRVQGASLDAHLTGPSDQTQFGFEDQVVQGVLITENSVSSLHQKPDKGHPSAEPGHNCDRDGPSATAPKENQGENYPTEKVNEDEQGDHNVPGASDTKHLETTAGSGLSGGTGVGQGQWQFQFYSPTAGFTDVVVWVDDEDLPIESEQRIADDDVMSDGEPSATFRAQWLSAPMTISFDPPSDTAPVGTCNKYTVKLRSGSDPVPGLNLDVHATGPNNDLDFCDPGDGSPRRAPDAATGTDHQDEDSGEKSHPGDAQAQHTEGETDADGNFVVGVISNATGDTTLQAWVDGYPGTDNDLQGAATAEPAATATLSWGASTGDAELGFVSPSAYGGSGTSGSGTGDQIGKSLDADEKFHVVVRTDQPDTVPGVELLIGSTADGAFNKIGDMTRVAGTDTYEFFWNVDVTDGNYFLRAAVPGTSVKKDRAITVNKSSGMDPRDIPFETLELTKPINGAVAPFTKRITPVEGKASAGAEGVDIFYTKLGAKDSPAASDWIFCGFVQLNGTGTTPQNFKSECKIKPEDQASQVTGIAAITYDCQTPNDGCDANPAGAPAREPGAKDSGDAHRVFGLESQPAISVEPAESSGIAGTCQKFTLKVVDSSGQGMSNQNVDAHLTGPGPGAHFCDPEGGSTRRAPDQGHTTGTTANEGEHTDTGTKHIEGETGGGGRFTFGVSSDAEGDTQILVWLDQSDNDNKEDTEPSDIALQHWTAEAGEGCTINGTDAADNLVGTSGPDRICGGDGDDVIKGLGGADVLIGGSGEDTMKGGNGNDRLKGRKGNDKLDGGKGKDFCSGGRGRDSVTHCEGGRT